MTSLLDKDKRKTFEALLEQGIAALHLDPRRAGVQVPPWLRDQAVLVLNYSYRYGIDDFQWDDEAVCASLSFARQPHFCRVPWSAVFGVTDEGRHQGRVWEHDVPTDLHIPQAAGPRGAAAEPVAAVETSPPSGRTRAPLQVIEGGASAKVLDADTPPSEPPPPSPRPALRRVK